MRRLHSIAAALLIGMACLWACMTLMAEFVKFESRHVLAAIQTETPPDMTEVEQSITAYEHMLYVTPCNKGLQEGLLLLYAYAADTSLLESVDVFDHYLAKTSQALEEQLACFPLNGKAWLDYARITMHREGFTDEVLHRYKMSAQVAPGEAWLAEKRLFFVLPVFSMLDGEGLTIVQEDMAVMQRALARRQGWFLADAGIASWESLTQAVEAAREALPHAKDAR